MGNIFNKNQAEFNTYDEFKRSATTKSIGAKIITCFDKTYKWSYTPVRWSHLISEDEDEEISPFVKYNPAYIVLMNFFISGFIQPKAEKVPGSLIWMGSVLGVYLALTIILKPFKNKIVFYVEILRITTFGLGLAVLTALAQSIEEGREVTERMRYKRLGNSLVFNLLISGLIHIGMGLVMIVQSGLSLFICKKEKKETAEETKKELRKGKETAAVITNQRMVRRNSLGFKGGDEILDEDSALGNDKAISRRPHRAQSKVSVNHFFHTKNDLLSPNKFVQAQQHKKAFNFALSVNGLE